MTSPETVIERCARAIAPGVFRSAPDDMGPSEKLSWESMARFERNKAIERARAVLLVLREPSEGMIIDGVRACYNSAVCDRTESAQLSEAFQAMIDAALAEKG